MRGDAEGMVNLSGRERPKGEEGGGKWHAMQINKQDVGI